MMKIRYTNTLQDGIAFTKYNYSNSNALKKQKRRATIHLPIIALFLMLALFAIFQNTIILIWGSVFIVFYVYFIFREFNKGVSKMVEKLYREKGMNEFVCEHILEIDDEGIIETTDVNERKDKWQGIKSINSNESYAFIYVGAMQAHIIPKERITEGNVDQFLKDANTFWEKKCLSTQEIKSTI